MQMGSREFGGFGFNFNTTGAANLSTLAQNHWHWAIVGNASWKKRAFQLNGPLKKEAD